jgi:hypothetical protein
VFDYMNTHGTRRGHQENPKLRLDPNDRREFHQRKYKVLSLFRLNFSSFVFRFHLNVEIASIASSASNPKKSLRLDYDF